MVKIDIISGFLGAGKTTLIKKLIAEAFEGEKLVLIENEFGEIGIDGAFLKDSGIQITEMNSGCICCSLVGDFGEALKEVLSTYSPDRVIIEPSGVGKLSDVIRAVQDITESAGKEVTVNSTAVVVDATKCKMYMKNYGEFYNNQIEYAGTIVLSRTQKMSPEKLDAVLLMIREKNAEASVITTPWEEIDGHNILEAMEKINSLEKELIAEEEHCHCHDEKDEAGHEHHHHHDHDHENHENAHERDKDHDNDHEHHHDHEHVHDRGDGHDHHHGDHEHDHAHGDHDHHHHHHADDVFASIGIETAHKYTEGQLQEILTTLSSDKSYGEVLRAKGIVPAETGEWFHFDLVPEETQIRRGAADYTGRVCVIGAKMQEEKIRELFHA